MPDSTARRHLLRRLGMLAMVPLAGCADGRTPDSPSQATAEIEPRETTPERVQGEPITVNRDASALDVTVFKNGSVAHENNSDVEPFSSWAYSQSIYLAEDALRKKVAEFAKEYRDEPVEWDLRWEKAPPRFLITTTLTLYPPVDNVAWPSILYYHLESMSPKKVTVVISTDEKSVSHEFPVFARAKLRSV